MISREAAINILKNDKNIDFSSFSPEEQEDIIQGVIRTARAEPQGNSPASENQLNQGAQSEDAASWVDIIGALVILVILSVSAVEVADYVQGIELNIFLSNLGQTSINWVAFGMAFAFFYIFSRFKSFALSVGGSIGAPLFLVILVTILEPVNIPEGWKFNLNRITEANQAYLDELKKKSYRSSVKQMLPQIHFASWRSLYDQENDLILVSIELFNDSDYLIKNISGDFSVGNKRWQLQLHGDPIEPRTTRVQQFYLPSTSYLAKKLNDREKDKVQYLTFSILSGMFELLKAPNESTTAGFKVSNFDFEDYDRNEAFQKEALVWLELD